MTRSSQQQNRGDQQHDRERAISRVPPLIERKQRQRIGQIRRPPQRQQQRHQLSAQPLRQQGRDRPGQQRQPQQRQPIGLRRHQERTECDQWQGGRPQQAPAGQ